MSKEERIELEGTILEALPNAMFKVELENSHQILAYVSENEDALYSYFAWRQGKSWSVTLWFDKRKNNI